MNSWLNQTHIGDCRALLGQMAADGVRVQTCVTSPPYYGLRDYGVAGQIGLEQTPADFVAALVSVFRAVRDVLADDGTLWLNLGDSYSGGSSGGTHSSARSTLRGTGHVGGGPKLRVTRLAVRNPAPGLTSKNLLGIPWRVAFALQDDGWVLRSDIIWYKPNPMPESVRDRPTRAHETIFLFAKSDRYFYDADAIREPYSEGSLERYSYEFQGSTSPGRRQPGNTDERYKERASISPNERGRNRRTVWTIPSQPFSGAHFATFPRKLIEPCILAGSRPGDAVLDPFMGSGTVAQVATDLGRHFIGCELNPEYVELHEMRRTTVGMPF